MHPVLVALFAVVGLVSCSQSHQLSDHEFRVLGQAMDDEHPLIQDDLIRVRGATSGNLTAVSSPVPTPTPETPPAYKPKPPKFPVTDEELFKQMEMELGNMESDLIIYLTPALEKRAKQDGKTLGAGWWGNRTGGGYKCTELNDILVPMLNKYVRPSQYYSLVSIFHDGPGPFNHIAIGIVQGAKPGATFWKEGDPGKLIKVIDPWRFSSCVAIDRDKCGYDFGHDCR